MRKISALFVFMCLLGSTVWAQSRPVTGEVINQENGEALPGVSVLVKGSKQGTSTDEKGNFKISVPEKGNAVLVLTNLGFQTQEISVGSQDNIVIKLVAESAALDAVVVVGYGTVKKKDLTGSVASLKGDELTKVPVTNVLEAAQGKVPGVDITRSSGAAGAAINITVRGNRSIKAGNGPLYIVDGVQYTDIQDINSNDIQSMDILKDASSTAIYGSRGANGVIIITTKKGAAGKMQVTVNAYNGFSEATGFPKVLDGQGYANLRREAQRTAGKWNGPQDDSKIFQPAELANLNNNISTRFPDLLLHHGRQQDYQIGFSGGTDKLKSYFSLDYFKEEGILIGDELNRYSGRVNLDYSLSKILKIGTETQLTVYKQKKRSDPMNTAMRINPLTSAFDSTGAIIVYPNLGKDINPLIDEQPGAYKDEESTLRIFPTVYAELKPLKGLTLRSNVSLNMDYSTEGIFRSSLTLSRNNAASQSSYSVTRSSSLNWQGIINYQKDLGEHSFNLTGIGEIIKNKTEGAGAQGQNQLLSSQVYYNLGGNTQNISIYSNYSENDLNSLAGRLNYSYKSKYLLTLTGRTDGASVLGKGHQWDFFPSAAAGWQIIKEDFMATQKLFSDLKLRASYGVSGNAAVSAYSSQNSMTSIPFAYGDNSAMGLTFNTQIGNPDLRWEKSSTVNVGLDFGLLNNRITGTVDAYDTRTKDLLLGRLLPPTTGATSVTQNVGKTHNRGIELALTSVNIQQSNLSWSSTITFTRNKEEISELTDGVNVLNIGTPTLPQFLVVGSPVFSFYDYDKVGIWQLGDKDAAAAVGQQPGDIRVRDVNNDGVIDAKNDRSVIGSSVPTWSGGFSNDVRYKNFDLNVYVYARVGQMINLLATGGGGTSLGHSIYDPQGVENSLQMLQYWTPENPTNDLPRPNALNAYTNTLYYNTIGYENGSFVKIRNISLGYNLPENVIKRAGLQKLKVYITGKNLFTFTNVKEYDPERGGNLSSPMTKLIVFGINATF